MVNRNPFEHYALLLWCRECGHFSKRAAKPSQSIPMVVSRASCSKCCGRSIGAVQFQDQSYRRPLRLQGWQLQLMARACDRMALDAFKRSDSIPPATDDASKLKHYKDGALYTEIAGALWLNFYARRDDDAN